jgi:hypothetical protein
MWLINVETKKLEYFIANPPSYAILSHTWAGQEVTFADFNSPRARSMAGWAKIDYTCNQAQSDNLKYCWVDTCCIDKSSSAELSECINSMYRWYADSAVCYAYLTDVEEIGSHEEFAASRWFTRGWTLQELLAPREMIFYGKRWEKIGTKEDLASEISQITHIEQPMLTGTTSLEYFSIAARMSWASMRETTRGEDIAYCLLGIFDVNMPLLYGEGQVKAFVRLQEEISNIYPTDYSLLAWGLMEEPFSGDLLRQCSPSNLLASHPREFRNCRDIVPATRWSPHRPYRLSRAHLEINLPIRRYLNNSKTQIGLICCTLEGQQDYCIGICLSYDGADSRIRCTIDDESQPQTFATVIVPILDAAQATNQTVLIRHNLDDVRHYGAMSRRIYQQDHPSFLVIKEDTILQLEYVLPSKKVVWDPRRKLITPIVGDQLVGMDIFVLFREEQSQKCFALYVKLNESFVNLSEWRSLEGDLQEVMEDVEKLEDVRMYRSSSESPGPSIRFFTRPNRELHFRANGSWVHLHHHRFPELSIMELPTG